MSDPRPAPAPAPLPGTLDGMDVLRLALTSQV